MSDEREPVILRCGGWVVVERGVVIIRVYFWVDMMLEVLWCMNGH